MSRLKHRAGVWVILGICILFAGSSAAQSKDFDKFVVYTEKNAPGHYVPSGYMPDGKCIAINDAWPDDCAGNKTCIQVKFDRDCTAIGGGWAGAYWLDPANNWGDVKGGFNLTGATKLVFSAKGGKGGEVVSFKMGGVGSGKKYADTDSASIDSIVLTKDWKVYTMDLTGKNLALIVGGFAWVATAKDNQSNITFYLKDIYYQ